LLGLTAVSPGLAHAERKDVIIVKAKDQSRFVTGSSRGSNSPLTASIGSEVQMKGKIKLAGKGRREAAKRVADAAIAEGMDVKNHWSGPRSRTVTFSGKIASPTQEELQAADKRVGRVFDAAREAAR
jgi:hypothetical protein